MGFLAKFTATARRRRRPPATGVCLRRSSDDDGSPAVVIFVFFNAELLWGANVVLRLHQVQPATLKIKGIVVVVEFFGPAGVDGGEGIDRSRSCGWRADVDDTRGFFGGGFW